MLKRAIRAGTLAAAMLLLTAGAASADNGPHVTGTSGGGTSPILRDNCATCHRAHTGGGGSAVPDETLCMICHSASAAGATTNVSDGVIASTTRALKGGGFTNAIMDTTWSSVATPRPVTSAHGSSDGITGRMWGAGPIGSGPGLGGVQVTCLNCHDPHGNGNYRILRLIPKAAPTSMPVTVTDEPVKDYTVTSTANRYFGEIYADGDPIGQQQLTTWCSSCHTRLNAPDSASGHTDSGDPDHPFRHRTAVLDMAEIALGNDASCKLCHASFEGGATATDLFGVTAEIAHAPVCENCHVAHGTAAQMGPVTSEVLYPGEISKPTNSNRSSLLRLDNRGVCVGCHEP